MPSKNQYPDHKIIRGASIAVFKDNLVLLAQRGHAPMQGLWSLPGGHIELNESPPEAALRELYEETRIEAELLGTVDEYVFSSQAPQNNMSVAVNTAYHLTVFYGCWSGGDIMPGDDCQAALWVKLENLNTFPLTPRGAEIIRKAWTLIKQGK